MILKKFFNRKMKIGFDKVYCVSYCRNIEKQNNIRKVMKYLGIDFEFIYGADYTNLNILKQKDFNFCINDDNELKKNWVHYTHFIGASYDHYTAVIHAYESGANSVLIMEDDCTFINDVSYIQWALNNYPKDADIVKFGYIALHYLDNFNDIKHSNNFKNHFVKNASLIQYAGSQLYGICNRETMKKYINLQQNDFKSVDKIDFRLSEKNVKSYSLILPIGIDKVGNSEDINEGYSLNKYTLLEHI